MLGVFDVTKSAGELRLQFIDPHVQPFLHYRYLDDEFDRRRMREMVRMGYNELRSRIVDLNTWTDMLAWFSWERRRLACSESGQDGRAPRYKSQEHHHGPVHGLHNLRVVEASTTPDCTLANTNATTMMIGERIADFIRQRR
jgi:choline dehydrogenase